MKNEPAFPVEEERKPDRWNHEEFLGLTKREYIATHILSAMVSKHTDEWADSELGYEETIVKVALSMTDELLKQL